MSHKIEATWGFESLHEGKADIALEVFPLLYEQAVKLYLMGALCY